MRTIESKQFPAVSPHSLRRFGGVAATGLLMLGMAACDVPSLDKDGDPERRGGDKQTSGACVTPEVAVEPGSALNRENQGDIASQLDALRTAHSLRSEVTVRNIINASSIVTNSLKDPLYARAFEHAERYPEKVDSAAKLVSMQFAGNRQQCLQHWQVETSEELYGVLVDGLAPKAGRQMSAGAELLYDRLAAGFDDFRDRVDKELGPNKA